MRTEQSTADFLRVRTLTIDNHSIYTINTRQPHQAITIDALVPFRIKVTHYITCIVLNFLNRKKF